VSITPSRSKLSTGAKSLRSGEIDLLFAPQQTQAGVETHSQAFSDAQIAQYASWLSPSRNQNQLEANTTDSQDLTDRGMDNVEMLLAFSDPESQPSMAMAPRFSERTVARENHPSGLETPQSSRSAHPAPNKENEEDEEDEEGEEGEEGGEGEEDEERKAIIRNVFGKDTKYNLSNEALCQVMDSFDNFIRPDLVEFLEDALPRWQNAGIWLPEELPGPLAEGTGRSRLFNAYSCICKLEARLGDDQIRNRMAMITLHTAYEQACQEWRVCRSGQSRFKRGRGDASSVIDDILERLHGDWDKSSTRNAQLRSRFHDKKRYGKRWLILSEALGVSVLIACSPKISSMV
jgi:hypothetical protein